IYTFLTSQEMYPVPADCPPSYDYPSQTSYDACVLRLVNLICMWSFVLFGFLCFSANLFGIMPTENDLNELWNEKKKAKIFTTSISVEELFSGREII
ncbi:9987_t:CDS:1, partial [Racocetra persica]